MPKYATLTTPDGDEYDVNVLSSAEKLSRVVDQGLDSIRHFLYTHRGKIETGYVNGEDELSISMSLKIKESERGGYEVECKASWTTEKVKFAGTLQVDPDQMELPLD